jgi:hypothetical protein
MREHIEIESDMRFFFDEEEWSLLIKYDEQTDYKKILNDVQETKAVDFVAILPLFKNLLSAQKRFQNRRF